MFFKLIAQKMYKQFLFWFTFISSIFYEDISARPISYSGGWTVMQMNDLNRHSIHLHFSPSVKYSLGYRAEYWRNREWQFHGAQFNYLLKRMNTRKSQANFYLKNGLGLALSDHKNFQKKIEPNLFTGFAVDWEDRQYFFSYENRINFNYAIDKFVLHKARIGLAPYIGEYGDLHTWFMLKVEKMSHVKSTLVFTPMLRFFKGDYLAEVGLSNYKDFMFNFIRRY